MLKDFDKFMSQLKETNQTLDFFCDFDKILENVEDIKLSLCMLNSLIGASDLRKSVETSNPQLSPSTSFLRAHVLSLLNYQIN